MFTLRLFTALPVLLCSMFFLTSQVDAATIYMSPQTGSYLVGQSFDVDVKINSSDRGFNVAELSVLFPKDILEVKTLTYTPAVSVFNFWLDTPYFSNATGVAGFIGGATQSLVGESQGVLRITFTAKGAGEAVVVISDAAVIASDGTGINILTGTHNARFNIAPSSITPELPVVAQPIKSEPEKVEPKTPSTQQIIRIPTPTAKLPVKPNIFVPLFPDQLKWSSVKSSFIVAWDLPTDVTDVSVIVNENKSVHPPQKSQGLSEAKEFPPLKDGVWYAHVMFKNKNGWGPEAHYRIGVDQVPPEKFTIQTNSGFVTDNPTPTISFGTTDNLSGVEKYIVQINDETPIETIKGEYTLPPQAPGLKNISVEAVDGAGNVTKESVAISIQPISSPAITFYTKNLHFGDSLGMVAGRSIPNAKIKLGIKSGTDQVVLQLVTTADEAGNWSVQIARSLSKGSYYVEIVAIDEREAQSLPVRSDLFIVHERPLFTVGSLDVTQGVFFGITFAVFVLGAILGVIFYRIWRKQLRRREFIAQRDITNIFSTIKSVLSKAITNLSAHKTKADASETKYLLEDLHKKLSEVEKYIVDNIKEIGGK